MTLVTRLSRIVLSTALAASAACAAELDLAEEGEALAEAPATGAVDGEAADLLAPLAAVERKNGNLVEIFEPRPGVLMYTETGTGAPLAGRYADVASLFVAAAPDAELPRAVIEAQDRADALGVVDGSVALGGAGAEEIDAERQVQDKTPRASCAATFSCYSSSGTDFHWCKPSWNNGFWAHATSINRGFHKVCSKTGTINTKFLVDSVPILSKTLGPGVGTTMGYISQGSIFSSGDYNMYTNITSASGDNFATTGFAIDD